MSSLGKTFGRWINFRIIQIGIFSIFAFSIAFFIIPKKYPGYSLLFGFWVEIIAVFCALIFGFYWERAHESIERESRLDKILELFTVELRENIPNLERVFKQGRGDYVAYSPKTTVWEVYKESLGEAEIETVDVLTEIYYNLNLLNTGILKYAGDPSMAGSTLDMFKKIRYNTVEQISAWLKILDITP